MVPSLDPAILDEVKSINAVDDHAHPLALGVEPKADLERPIQRYEYPLPLRQRQSNAEYLDAWTGLWGYEHGDWTEDHLRELILRKQTVQAEQGSSYNTWVLDQLKVETMIAVAYEPSPTLPEPRFRWCAFADWFLWPFTEVRAQEQQLIANYVRMVGVACSRAGLDTPPPTLHGYLTTIVGPELHRFKDQGVVALKFQTPYYRFIDFADVRSAEADALYQRGLRDGGLESSAHRAFEDYLFRWLVREAGSLNLPVQMHTGLGARPHFEIRGSNPLLMESIFAATPRTKFLLLHGGWPFEREALSALAHENVFLDFSCATIHLYPRALSQMIRAGLEWFPEKIMYGTDAYSDRSIAMLSGAPVLPNPLSGWEEKAWLMDRTAREAVAMALTGMRQDGEITWDNALGLSQMVMRDNALALYGLGDA